MTPPLRSEKSTRNDSAPFPPFASFYPPLVFLDWFLVSLASFLPFFRSPISVTPRNSCTHFSIPAFLSRKMSPSLSGMSARVQVEFRTGPRTMSLPLEMLDNIGHQESPMEHEVDNSYKLSRIRREHVNQSHRIDSYGVRETFNKIWFYKNDVKWHLSSFNVRGWEMKHNDTFRDTTKEYNNIFKI